MHDDVIDSLRDLAGEFQRNELAYLALTAKIEGPLRDRWAYALHKTLAPNYVVAREWSISGERHRADLAILVHQSPQAIIELKAIYSFDVINGRHRKIIKDLRADAEKWANCGGARIYTVLLVTHPDGKVADDYERTVKYMQGINRAVGKCGSPEKVKAQAKATLQNDFGQNDVVSGELNGGQAFGTILSVLWWARCEADLPMPAPR